MTLSGASFFPLFFGVCRSGESRTFSFVRIRSLFLKSWCYKFYICYILIMCVLLFLHRSTFFYKVLQMRYRCFYFYII